LRRREIGGKKETQTGYLERGKKTADRTCETQPSWRSGLDIVKEESWGFDKAMRRRKGAIRVQDWNGQAE